MNEQVKLWPRPHGPVIAENAVYGAELYAFGEHNELVVLSVKGTGVELVEHWWSKGLPVSREEAIKRGSGQLNRWVSQGKITAQAKGEVGS